MSVSEWLSSATDPAFECGPRRNEPKEPTTRVRPRARVVLQLCNDHLPQKASAKGSPPMYVWREQKPGLSARRTRRGQTDFQDEPIAF